MIRTLQYEPRYSSMDMVADVDAGAAPRAMRENGRKQTMSAMFELPLPSETLDAEEVSKIAGCSRIGDQIEWLKKNGWVFFQNRAGAPVIGRLYARLKLAGINPASMAAPEASGWRLDVSKVQ